MVQPPRRPTLQLSQSMNMTGRPDLQLQQKLCPPVAETAEEVVRNARPRNEISDVPYAVLNRVHELINGEGSVYTDARLTRKLSSEGYDVTRRTIVLARDELGIKPLRSRIK